MGDYLKAQLTALGEKTGEIEEVRGVGLIVGIGFKKPIAKALKEKLFNAGFLVGNVGDNTIRLLPPLIISKEDLDSFIAALEDAIKSI